MIVTGIFCLLVVVVAVGEGWAAGRGTRAGQSSSESIYGEHLLEINGFKVHQWWASFRNMMQVGGWSSTL